MLGYFSRGESVISPLNRPPYDAVSLFSAPAGNASDLLSFSLHSLTDPYGYQKIKSQLSLSHSFPSLRTRSPPEYNTAFTERRKGESSRGRGFGDSGPPYGPDRNTHNSSPVLLETHTTAQKTMSLSACGTCSCPCSVFRCSKTQSVAMHQSQSSVRPGGLPEHAEGIMRSSDLATQACNARVSLE